MRSLTYTLRQHDGTLANSVRILVCVHVCMHAFPFGPTPWWREARLSTFVPQFRQMAFGRYPATRAMLQSIRQFAVSSTQGCLLFVFSFSSECQRKLLEFDSTTTKIVLAMILGCVYDCLGFSCQFLIADSVFCVGHSLSQCCLIHDFIEALLVRQDVALFSSCSSTLRAQMTGR